MTNLIGLMENIIDEYNGVMRSSGEKGFDCSDRERLETLTHYLEKYVLFAYGVATNQQKTKKHFVLEKDPSFPVGDTALEILERTGYIVHEHRNRGCGYATTDKGLMFVEKNYGVGEELYGVNICETNWYKPA